MKTTAKKVLQEHKNYNKLLRRTRELIEKESIQCLIMGGEGYAKHITDMVREKFGSAYTEESYLEFFNDVRQIVASEYGPEC